MSVVTDLYPHMAAHALDKSTHALANSSDFGLLIFCFWGAQFPMCDSLPWTLMKHCAKFNAASFIFGEEIRNSTNTHTHTKQ